MSLSQDFNWCAGHNYTAAFDILEISNQCSVEVHIPNRGPKDHFSVRGGDKFLKGDVQWFNIGSTVQAIGLTQYEIFLRCVDNFNGYIWIDNVSWSEYFGPT